MHRKITILKYLFEENKNKIRIWLTYFLIATLGFGIGYLANREFSHVPLIVEKCSNIAK